MSSEITALVLQEFRLHAADTAGEAARIIAAFAHGIEPTVPLLTSIDDRRDMATVRALHPGEPLEEDPGQRVALGPLVASWQPLKRYRPRITERSNRSPTHYRLAVTESGVNDGGSASLAPRQPRRSHDAASTPLSLLWTGVPLGTYAGLMLLLGSEADGRSAESDPADWPLPLSGSLGVRIYESRN
jgi:hypothetical protein